ncbi:MAG: hypothetical protein GTO33_10110, partial [Acidobacteria bacterium]|nr:hypothetical protein [Acidobacteriota bacterium]
KLLAGAAGALVGAAALGPWDYSQLPPDPAELQSKVQGRAISLNKAVEIACKETGGHA